MDAASSSFLPDKRNPLRCKGFRWWARVDSNHRPHPYQGCALTGLSYGPRRDGECINGGNALDAGVHPESLLHTRPAQEDPTVSVKVDEDPDREEATSM